MRHWSFLSGFTADLRYALRRWRLRPGFATTVVLTLALGIATVTSIFSVVDAVLLKPLPWAAPESLVMVHGVYPERRDNPATAPTWNRWRLSYPALEALRTAPAFEAVGAWQLGFERDATIGDDRAEIITALEVSANLLSMLGVKLSLGRHFGTLEEQSVTDHVILSDEIWRRRFGGRPDVIGERIMIGSARFNEEFPRTIIGVVAPGFEFDGIRPDLLRPIPLRARMGSDGVGSTPHVKVVARLAPGVSVASGDAQAAVLAAAPPNDDSRSARVVPFVAEQLGPSRRPLWLLFGGASILLLVACSNVAGLLLGEARLRRHEFAVRAALGGSRARVVRPLVVEHAMLAAGGAVIGLIAAYWLTGAVVAMAPAGMPRIDATAVDGRTALFAVAAGVFTLLIFGVTPALALARTPVAGVLASAGRDGAMHRVTGQRLIVVSQVVLALVLLTGATLFGETMLKLHAQPLGFDPDGVAVVATTFTGNLYGDPEEVKKAWQVAGPGANPGVVLTPLRTATTTARTDGVLERLSALPDVTHAAATSAAPFVASPDRMSIALQGPPDGESPEALQQIVTDTYFATLGVRLLSGRSFEPSDGADTRVAVVSAEFERRFFPDGAIDRLFNLGQRYDASAAHRIVGVVTNVKRQEYTDDDRPMFYRYYRQGGTPGYFLVRTAGDPTRVLPAVRRAVGDVSPQIIVTSMTTMASRLGESVTEERFRATLSAIFGTAALVLAAVGLYGLATRRVADRRREFGVRVALGARPVDVRRLVVRDSLIVVSIGLMIGLPASFATAQVTRSLLFGVTSTAPHVFAITGLVLAIVVMTATILPARRAGRVDPAVALKH